MKLSVILPAHNEAKRLPATLRALKTAAAEAALEYELIVADDDSTDETAARAREGGARVVRSGKRNIGATRNVGAKASAGDWLLFLDADTQPTAQALSGMAAALRGGAVAGGARMTWLEQPQPWILRWGLEGWNLVSRTMHWPAGGFYFVRRDAFEKVGGFDERFFASEEIHLTRALKKHGRVVIVPGAAATSTYKMEKFTTWELVLFVLKLLVRPHRHLKDRDALSFWYQRR